MRRNLVIGLDASTTACKAMIWDPQGNAVAGGSAPLTMLATQPGWHEQSADQWWQSAVQALRQAANQVDPRHLAALCITPQRETFVPVDSYGKPLRNGILWMDERCRSLLPDLEQQFGKEKFHQRTGKPLSVNLTIGKIAWLRQNEPEIFAQSAKYLDVHAYLVFHLTGQYRTGWGCADPTGLFDMTRNAWSEDFAEQVGLRIDQFPEAFAPGAILGTITPQAAQSCNLPPGLPVIAGIGDGQSCGLGTGTTQPGEAYLTLGTSVVSGAFSSDYRTSLAFRTMYGGIPGSYLLETAIMGGGYTISWFIDQFANRPGYNHNQNLDYYDHLADAIPPGCDGLTLVPYWNSVLGPYWDASATGIVVGWRGIHQPAHLFRAILEGIAFEQRLCLLGVESVLEQNIERLVAVGGGARSDLWCQIFADVTGKLVYRASTTEAASLGAAVLAASAVGLYADTHAAAKAMVHLSIEPFQPNPLCNDFYTRRYEDVYQNLYPALRYTLSKI